MDNATREHAYALLEKAVIEHKSFAAVAKLLGINRATVSTVARRCYPGDDTNVLRRVLGHFDRFVCPHLRAPLTPDECRGYWSGAAPSHNPLKMEHWRACRSCSHRGGTDAHP
jgi:hypothetical protein